MNEEQDAKLMTLRHKIETSLAHGGSHSEAEVELAVAARLDKVAAKKRS